MKKVMNDGEASVDHLRDTLKIMQQLASDQNKSKRDNLYKDIFKWLSPPDPWKNHNLACKSRHHESASWFIQGDTFKEWKTSEATGSLLWAHGKPGAGKSIFCSTIIEDIDSMRKAGLASLAFFYFDFREDQKKDLRGLLSSLLVQLCRQSDSYYEMLSEFYSKHDKGSRHPSDDALVGCLKDLLKLPGLAPVYLIVDALDECPDTSAIPSPRAEVLNLLEELINSRFSNLRICVTSRPEIDIKGVLDPLVFRSVSLHDRSEQKRDIEEYIKSTINTHPKNRRWKAEHKQLVIDVLTKKADGMFRWVYCQVVYICGCIPARIQHALADLPDTLDGTYERTLREINKADWEFAHRLFQFVAVASRPLRVEELAELLAYDFKAGPIPKFHEGWRLENPTDAVLSTCSSLLAIVDGYVYPFEEVKLIQFSHFSVKEYLTSTRLAEATDIIPRRYHVSMTPAHTLVAQACFGILLHLDKDVVTRDSLEKWPLAQYAAKHWADHTRFEGVSQNVEDCLRKLFDPRKPHLAVCVWIHNPDTRSWLRNEQGDSPSSLLGTPLHYAALWGFQSIVEFLVTEHSQNVHSRYFIHDETPLDLASSYGHLTAVHLLIERGADVAAQNEHGETSLHLALTVTSFRMALKPGQVEVARMLIERGADVVAQNKDGDAPLHLASRNGQVEVACMLIERGADVAAQNKDGFTSLHMASRNGEVEVARMLIERGADVAAQNKDRETALHLASRPDLSIFQQQGLTEVSLLLLEHGADVNAKNKYGLSPFHLASQCWLDGDRRQHILRLYGGMMDPGYGTGELEKVSPQMCITGALETGVHECEQPLDG
ncbi:hypothetical protein DFH94DRAFT_655887 [Russula ochroleuca]|uniref:Nephrocystin 3-like N-terminal domain-containing protein n=1 Tax=Russula ochroleuca TaxID=152965 RepID=A0A9P5JYC3_9AGAM|nr:hypothetical protein DFH94DRAFT_655887 [Russula ochroleuca]